MRTSITVTRVVEAKDEAFQCDRCGTIAAAPFLDRRPDGWLLMKNAELSDPVEDYCSAECLAQTMARRVGKVLA